MVTFEISPIEMTTCGGYKATINGINTENSDYFAGKVKTKAGTFKTNWDLNGIARGMTDMCNLDTTTDEFKDLKKSLKNLRIKV